MVLDICQLKTTLYIYDNISYIIEYSAGQMSGYYNPYTSAGFSAAHMAAAAAAAAAQQTGQVKWKKTK